jgi:hypothetical protein
MMVASLMPMPPFRHLIEILQSSLGDGLGLMVFHDLPRSLLRSLSRIQGMFFS